MTGTVNTSFSIRKLLSQPQFFMLFLFFACQVELPNEPQRPSNLSTRTLAPQFEPLPWPKEGTLLKKSVSLDRCLAVVPSCQCWIGDDLKETCAPQYVSETLELPHLMFEQIRLHTWNDDCPVHVEDLRLLRVLHWTENGAVQWGELILTERVASDASNIFQELYAERFPIHSLKPAFHYQGSDEASMADNNSSAFNCRKVKGSNRWSEHSFGESIDINPLWNPWVKGERIYPKNAADFVARTQNQPGMINEGDKIIEIFERYGWRWGSLKTGVNDYQHFSRADHEEVYGDQ